MGNALRRSAGEEEHAGGDDSEPAIGLQAAGEPSSPNFQCTIILQGGGTCDSPQRILPLSRRRPTREQALGRHGVRVAAARAAALDQYILNFISTSMRSSDSDELGNTMVIPQYQCNIEGIDESSARGLCNAVSYAKAKANAMLIQVPVLGTTKTFWRLSDDATRISRKLALILKSYHSVGKYLTAPLQVSNVWIGSTGSVKLRGVCFTDEKFSIARVSDDYKHLCEVLLSLIHISGGDLTKLPPDYMEFLRLLRDDLLMRDEFLIVNNPALLPMSNRTEVFLMLYDRIVTYLGCDSHSRFKKRRILAKLPYEDDWLDTAIANTQINQWVINVENEYKITQLDQLRLNRNVRCHLHEYNDENIEEILYYEWPELLMDMVKLLHEEGELQGTDIRNKFG